MKATHQLEARPAKSEGRRILLTGASAGLGRALAEVLADRGERLALVARRREKLEDLADRIRSRWPSAVVHVLPADLAEPGATGRVAAEAVERLGGLDVLINNAGLGLPRFFGESEPEAIGEQVAVNLVAPLLLTRHALPALRESRGMVINIGSAITVTANPALGVYGTTKAALAYFSEALRREVRHQGIRVCLVEPGPVETDFFEAVQGRTPDGRKALGASPRSDWLYNPLRDRPPAFLAISAEEAARRVARLIDRPRRRLGFPRRTIWPWRFLGAACRVLPGLTDLAVSKMVVRIDRERC